MAGEVLTCMQYDEATDTCTVEAWVMPPAPALPPLSIQDAQAIGAAILLVWAVAFVVRACARALNQN